MRGDGTTGTVFYLDDFSCSIAGVEYVSWRDWGDFYNKFARTLRTRKHAWCY